jgi:hypothetical protein
VRDELLTSERYWKVSPEARCLFVGILLSADDTARFTGANFALRTKCMAGTVDSERIERLLTELVDVDLVRAYMVKDARYLFVPRFRQRLRFEKSKYPEPPKQISDLTEKKTDASQTQAVPKTDSRQSQDGRSEEKRREVKPLRKALGEGGFDRFWSSYPRKASKGDAEKAFASIAPNEQLVARILAGIERAKTSEQWRKDGGKFIPYPATWLRAKGWEDEFDIASQSPKAKERSDEL